MSSIAVGSLAWAQDQVETMLKAALSDGGKGVFQSGLKIDDKGALCGLLMKKGEGSFFGGAGMKRRYFRLLDKTLSYYKSDKDGTKAQGLVDLDLAFKIELSDAPIKDGPAPGEIYLTVSTPERLWVFGGPLEYVVKWGVALKFATKDNSEEEAKAANVEKKRLRKQNRSSMVAMNNTFQMFSRFAGKGKGTDVRPPGTIPAEAYDLEFESGPLFLDLVADDDDNIVCAGFANSGSGEPGPAEKTGKIKSGDYLLGVNGTSFETLKFYDAIDVIRKAEYPKSFTFERPPVEPTPDKEAWLGKRGEQKLSAFRRRYFKLYGTLLFYYKPTMKDTDCPNENAAGHVDLASVKAIKPYTVNGSGSYSSNRLELDTDLRTWVLGFEEQAEMGEWVSALSSATGVKADEVSDISSKAESGGGSRPITFMLSLQVPEGANAGAVLEVEDPYGRKIRVTVPDDLPEDRKMSVPVEAPQISDQEAMVKGACTRRCWFLGVERQRYALLYSDRILIKRSEGDAHGAPLFFGEMMGYNQFYSSDEGVGRLLFQTNKGDIEVLGFASKIELDEWSVAVANVVQQKYPSLTLEYEIDVGNSDELPKDLVGEEDVEDVYSGWMWKRGEKKGLGVLGGSTEKGMYRRRWFALRHNLLMYFKYQKSDKGYGIGGSHDTTGRAGVIDMSTVQSVTVCNDDSVPDNSIAVKAINRTYILAVPSDDEFDEWLERLQTAADVYGGEQGTEALEQLKVKESASEKARVAAIKASVKHAGVLTKDSQKKYFVLDSESIGFYNKQADLINPDADTVGSMRLIQVQGLCWPSKKKSGAQGTFEVQGLTASSTWVLEAASEDEAKEWVRMIAKVSDRLELKESEGSLSTVNLSGQAGNRLAAYNKKVSKKKKKKIGGRGKAKRG